MLCVFSCPASGGAGCESEPPPPLPEGGAITENGALGSSDSKEEGEKKEDKEEDAKVEQEVRTHTPKHTHTRAHTAALMMSHLQSHMEIKAGFPIGGWSV